VTFRASITQQNAAVFIQVTYFGANVQIKFCRLHSQISMTIVTYRTMLKKKQILGNHVFLNNVVLK